MDASFALLQFLNGLASASALFITASGLTIVFGVTRIVNFAHASFYMLGAYLAVTLTGPLSAALYAPFGFWLAIFLSALTVGVIGVVMEMVLLRRVYRAPELFQLLATFGVVLVVGDLVILIWGPADILGPRAPGLAGAVEIFGGRLPHWDIVMILAGPLVLGLLWLLFQKTRFGVLVRAATQDREMVGALGVNQAMLFTGTLFLGAFLGGLGGALTTPTAPATPGMDIAIIVEAFVVTVIGGMGSVPGAFLAALIIGELQAFGILVLPRLTLVLVFLAMAVVLVIRPWGLLGRPETTQERVVGVERSVRLDPRLRRVMEAAVLALLVALPVLVDDYTLNLAIEVLIFAVFAFSLGFLIGNAGLVSFGHAAYFGLGAYGAAILVHHLSAPMELALIAAPITAAAGAALFGYFVVRLSGIYLAMLTLAFAEIVRAVTVQWTELTGGSNGLIGIWPADWASARVPYYYLTLAICCLAFLGLRRAMFAPFGYTARAGRDSALRADAIGIDLRRHRWLVFTLAGAAAGLAGGLYVFSKGNVDPTVLSIGTSVDGLAMVLLGGIHTVLGPVVGAGALHLLQTYVMPLTDYWRLILGLIVIALVVAFPQGIVGSLGALMARVRGR